MSRAITLVNASFLLALSVPAAFGQPLQARHDWEAFRNAYPYHIQVVAAGDKYTNGGRTLIVSEPPPGITVGQLQEVDRALLANYALWREGIGFDGWVEDAVFELPPVTESQFQELVAKLHIRLFGTAYKALAVEIPHSQPRNTSYQFDLHVPASTLRKWLLGQEPSVPSGWFLPLLLVSLALWGLRVFGKRRKMRHGLALLIAVIGLWLHFDPVRFLNHGSQIRFAACNGGPARTSRDILASRLSGVFFSEKPGLVLWSFPRTSPLDSRTRNERQFALDSDILLGAIASPDQIAVIARERIAPISILPPLRTETIMQLASVKDDELSQSYERNDFFAGKLDGSDNPVREISLAGQTVRSDSDWAPIFLSRQLIDTEYGSLLNITDQLLKSWSMHGLVRYRNFPYPDPASYPFPQALPEHAHVRTVLFNWNTKGAGYSMTDGPLGLFAWNRTGALPVDYLGDEDARLREAEETGYDYFAHRNDPNLVRVVQYAELYQVFHHFGVTAGGPTPAIAEQPRPGTVFRANLIGMLVRIHSAVLKENAPPPVVTLKNDLDSFVETYGEEALSDVAKVIGDPRVAGRDEHDSRSEAIRKLAFACQKNKYLLVFLTGLNQAEAAEEFVESSRHSTLGWIHTPSIVISLVNDPDMPGATGGHNLDAAITTFRTSPEISSGDVKVMVENGQRVVLYNPTDEEKIPETVRAAARDARSETELENSIEQTLHSVQKDERTFETVLAFGDAAKPEAARGLQLAHACGSSDRTGWWVRTDVVTEPQARLLGVLGGRDQHTIVIQRTAAGIFQLFDGPSHRMIEAGNRPAAIDAMLASMGGSDSGPIRLHLRGFEPWEGQGFVKSGELQLEALHAKERTITATIEDQTHPLNTEELKAILAEKYKFDEIEITKISKPFLTERGETALDVEAKVKPVSGLKALILRFRIILREGAQATQELISAITLRIQTAFHSGEIQAAPDGTLLLTKVLIRDLERVHPDIKYVEGRVVHESKDIYVAHNRNPQLGFAIARAAA
jgi:hypothetical protein